MKILILLIGFVLLTTKIFAQEVDAEVVIDKEVPRFWEIQAIDTMKFSRDLARQKMDDELYNVEIDTQVKNIADTGATHISISTPFDEEFLPYLRRWVAAARKHNLNVWFRGNFAGWEGWFDYPPITREEHIQKTRNFIVSNPDLFMDGDIFVSCPECENGGPGDPRQTGDVIGYRNFLISEYRTVNEAFISIDKEVITNYYSMNGDVAKLVMDKKTTEALDGIVTIDHYVQSNDKFVNDINDLAANSNGQIILGEWGAPIPDIHGEMSEQEQADYLEEGFSKIVSNNNVIGINYWTHMGSSTEIWDNDYNPKAAVAVITRYFKPQIVSGNITDTRGEPIHNATVKTSYRSVTARYGKFAIPIVGNQVITIEKEGYQSAQIDTINPLVITTSQNVILLKSEQNFIEKIMDYLHILFNGKSLAYATMNS